MLAPETRLQIPVPPNLPCGNDLVLHVCADSLLAVQQQTGMTVRFDIDFPAGWLHLTQNVREHVDNTGRCLLYCGQGAGILKLNQTDPIYLYEGACLIFNDRKRHSFELIGESCSLLAAPVSGRLKSAIRRGEYFLGEWVY